MHAHLTIETLNRYRSGATQTADEIAAIDAHLHTCEDCRHALGEQTQPASTALTRHLAGDADETYCLTEEELAAYAEERMDEEGAETAEAHLHLCLRCREDVANLREFHEQTRDYDWQKLEDVIREETQRSAHTAAAPISWFGRVWSKWRHLRLNQRILLAVVAGIALGLIFGKHAQDLADVSALVLKLLAAFATPFIFIAIIRAVSEAEVDGRTARRLIALLLTNSLVAVSIGLLVANLFHPGRGASINIPLPHWRESLSDLVEHTPTSLLQPLIENNFLFVILLALGFGFALRAVRREQKRQGAKDYETLENLLSVLFRCLNTMLQWIVAFVPLAVCVVVAQQVGTLQWGMLGALLGFVGAVLFALALQAAYYLLRIHFQSWVSPRHFFHSVHDALLTAFSTASSAVTVPVTYTCARERIGLREKSTSLGVLIGGQFNRDGTALFEAMAPLFITQAIGLHLSLPQQATIAIMAVIASIAAPGVPEAGLVTMLIVFGAVHLNPQYIPLLVTVDWLLDRCRTAVNVMGGLTVTCILDGRAPRHTPSAPGVTAHVT